MAAKLPKDQYGDVQWNMGTLFTMVQNIEENVEKIMKAQSDHTKMVSRVYATKVEVQGVRQIADDTRTKLHLELDPIIQQFERTQKLLGTGSKVSRLAARAAQTILTSTLTLLVAYYFNKYFS